MEIIVSGGAIGSAGPVLIGGSQTQCERSPRPINQLAGLCTRPPALPLHFSLSYIAMKNVFFFIYYLLALIIALKTGEIRTDGGWRGGRKPRISPLV